MSIEHGICGYRYQGVGQEQSWLRYLGEARERVDRGVYSGVLGAVGDTHTGRLVLSFKLLIDLPALRGAFQISSISFA